ncbi:SAV_2336 N-terminal domain-related protein [Streptomyces bohaiensis]|uniref:SAV_2336 N-terminal domain-related protein n=1 Tax=Streptomyces bohaiensis TaxID=1431344 RepID=UPI0028A90BE8|nr:SAV_2336 N-terminal domain-related protein [Streptomyces bohaiensis]
MDAAHRHPGPEPHGPGPHSRDTPAQSEGTRNDPPTTSTQPADQLFPPTVHKPSDGSGNAGPRSEGGLRGVPLRLARAEMLQEPLAVMGSLRPVGRHSDGGPGEELDEQLTVEQSIEQQMLSPVLRPARTRGVDLMFVVDAHHSMVLWDDLTEELRRAFTRSGVFRDARTWFLTGTAAGGTPMIAHRRGAPPRHPQELADPSGHRLILVCTDLVAGGWRESGVQSVLRQWGRHNAVAVLNVLPERLWTRGAVRPVPFAVRSDKPAAAGQTWNLVAAAQRPHRRRRRPAAAAPAIAPVVSASAASLARLAHLVSGDGRWWNMHCLRLDATAPPEKPVAAPGPTADGLAAAERFKTTASPTAQQLAAHLAAVPLTLPVMTLVRRSLLTDSDHGHLVEVALGGLLEPWSKQAVDTAPDDLRFDFLPGVREALIGSQLRGDVAAVRGLVRSSVWEYIARGRPSGREFSATRVTGARTGSRRVEEGKSPFAERSARRVAAPPTNTEAASGTYQTAGPGEALDPADSGAERFLRGETDPERRRVILDCALPQEIDADVYRALVDPNATAGAEAWLGALPFVTSRGGRYRYHDIVRTQMLRLQRSRSATDWTRRHTTLADHHAHQRTTLEPALPDVYERWANKQWRDHRAAEMYHRLCANPHDTRLAILEDCVHAAGASTETLTRWVRLIHHAGHDSGDTTLTERATALGNNNTEADPETALRSILAEPGLPTATRALAHHLRGRAHRAAGNNEQAIADFTRAIELEPDNAANYRWRGLAGHSAGDYQRAIADFTRAIELEPDNAANHRWRGLAGHSAGDYQRAIADLTRAIELEPDNAANHHLRGLVGHSAGDYQRAIADLTRAIELEPDNAWDYHLRGLAHRAARNNEQAIADLTRAIELEPDNAANHRWRGRASHSAGDYQRAIADFTRAIELEPDNAWDYHLRGLAHRAARNNEQAIADFTRAIELEPDNVWNYRWRGRAGHSAGDYQRAIADFTRAIELEPDNANNHHWRGLAHRAARNNEQAIADFTRAIELEPDNVWNYRWRGRASHEAGDNERAIADFTRAIELEPDNANNHHWRGRMHYAALLLGAALSDLSRAVELQPDEEEYRRWRDVVRYEVEGRGDEEQG